MDGKKAKSLESTTLCTFNNGTDHLLRDMLVKTAKSPVLFLSTKIQLSTN